MLPRRLLPWLFALTLLFGQAAAFAHALTHLHGQDPAPPDHVCEVCVAQAHLGSAAPAAAPGLSPAPARFEGMPAAEPVRISVFLQHAQARAPPAAI